MKPNLTRISGKKGDSVSVTTESANSLQSNTYARMQDLLGYGEWEGLVDGAKSIYLNKTPLQNADNTYNFKSTAYVMTPGVQDQKCMSGFETAESYVAVGLRLAPFIVRTITDSSVDKLVVTIKIPQLFWVKQDTNEILETRVGFHVDISLNGGEYNTWRPPVIATPPEGEEPGAPYYTAPLTVIYQAKCTSDYLESFEVTLPRSATPDTDTWQIRVRREGTDHYGSSTYKDDIYWESYSEIVNVRLRFPNCVLSGLSINAQDLSSIPERSWHVRMKKIKIPANYDPIARTYAISGPGTTNGGWDGTFKVAWSNNPAWVFYDITTDKESGAGQYLSTAGLSKWELYDAGKYCDRMVDDGYGGLEPLFTANLYLQVQNDALTVLNDLASCFRSMLYYYAGKITVVQDRPSWPVAAFTNANVKNGLFQYSSTAKRSRKTVAYVRYLDKTNYYTAAVQPVEDYMGILRYGYQEVDVTAFACTSRGQAHRYGKYVLETEKREFDITSFRTGLEALQLRIGNIIEVQDRDLVQVSHGGRLAGTATVSSITLDRPVLIEAGKTYSVSVTMPKAMTEPDAVTDSTQTGSTHPSHLEKSVVTNDPGSVTTLTLATPLSGVPDAGAIWVLTASDLTPLPYRVLSIKELENNEYEISANRYDVEKYDSTEIDPEFSSPPVARYPQSGVVAPVTNVSVKVRSVVTPDGVVQYIDLGWTNADAYVDAYNITYSTEGGETTTLPLLRVPSCSFPTPTPGVYSIRIFAVRTVLGQRSSSPIYTVNVTDSNPLPKYLVTGLELKDRGNLTDFEGLTAKLVWRMNSPALVRNLGAEEYGASEDGTTDPYFSHYLFRVVNPASNSVVFQDTTKNTYYNFTLEQNKEMMSGAAPLRRFTVQVYAIDKYGNRSAPATLTVQNPAPAIPQYTTKSMYGEVRLQIAPSTDTDFLGYMVWASPTDSLVINDQSLKYAGPNTDISLAVAPGGTLRIVIAAYDAFGKTGLRYSPIFAATATSVYEIPPPAVPIGVYGWPSRELMSDGTQQCRITFGWTPNTEPNFLHYAWKYHDTRQPDLVWVSGTSSPISANRVEIIVAPNVEYGFTVCAVNVEGISSPWTNGCYVWSLKDTVPPAKPVWLSGTPSFRQIFLSWQKATEKDFDHWRLYQGTTPVFASATLIGATLRSNSEIISAPVSGAFSDSVLYFWLVAVDTSDNDSAVSDVFVATLSALPAPTGLTLSSVVETQADGTQTTFLTASVAASSAAELASYSWQISRVTSVADTWSGTTTERSIRVPVSGNVTYLVRARINDSNGGCSAWTAESSVLTARDTAAPTTPSGLAATSAIATVFLDWTTPPEKDYQRTNIYRDTSTTKPVSKWASSVGTSFTDTLVTTGVIYNYWITHEDSSGNESAASLMVSSTPGKIGAANINDFAVTATKQFNDTIVLSGDVWTDHYNSVAGAIGWSAFTIYYRGIAYAINAANTDVKYIYWTVGDLWLIGTGVTPELSDNQFMIATNVGGVHDLAWNALANSVIGTAHISDLAVTNAKVYDLNVDKLRAGTITSQEIILSGASSILRSSNYVAGSAGWRILGDGNAEFSNVTVRGRLTGSTIDIGANANAVFKVDADGNMWIGAANYADAPFRVSNTGTLLATSAVITGSTSVAGSLAVGVTFILGSATQTATSIMQSYGYSAGVSGWRVRGNGDAEFNNVIIRGSSSIIAASVAPVSPVVPTGSGLYLGSNFLGFYNGSQWKSYMSNTGDFHLNGDGANYLQWNGAVLNIKGSITLTNTIDYSQVSGTRPPANADVTLSAINGGLTITGGGLTLTGGGVIQSGNYVAGTTGWHINSDGSAELNDVVVRGRLEASKIATNNQVYNPVYPSTMLPATGSRGANGGTTFGEPVLTVYGVGVGGDPNSLFGRSRTTFLVTWSLWFILYSGESANATPVYRVNGGSWTPASWDNGLTEMYSGITVTWPVALDLNLTDTVDFGVIGTGPRYQGSIITAYWSNQ